MKVFNIFDTQQIIYDGYGKQLKGLKRIKSQWESYQEKRIKKILAKETRKLYEKIKNAKNQEEKENAQMVLYYLTMEPNRYYKNELKGKIKQTVYY